LPTAFTELAIMVAIMVAIINCSSIAGGIAHPLIFVVRLTPRRQLIVMRLHVAVAQMAAVVVAFKSPTFGSN